MRLLRTIRAMGRGLRRGWNWVCGIFVVVWVGSHAFAQTLQDVLTEVINYDYTQAFVDTTGVAGLAVLLTKLVRVASEQVAGRSIEGLTAYAVPILISVLAGLVGQATGWIPSTQLSGPFPLGGLMFGVAAGLSAVGLHQAKRQTEKELQAQAARLRR